MTKLASIFFVLILVPSIATGQGVHSLIASHCCSAPTISAKGVGRRSFPTSIAIVRLSVEADRQTAREAQLLVASKSANLISFLKMSNVDKLQTTGVSLSARMNYDATPVTLVGYSGSNSVSFEVPISRAGALLDGAVRFNASKIGGVSFKATKEVSGAARRQALVDATKAARAEAKEVAAALGVGLGAAKEIKISENLAVQATPIRAAVGGADAGTSAIVGGESSVSAQVSIVFDQARL